MASYSIMSLTQSWLVRKLKERDPDTFEELVRKYERPIFNMLFRMTGVREEAEDLAQEVFITVFRKISLFREEASLATWMHKIALNLFRNRQKYLKRRHAKDMHPLDEAQESAAAKTSGAGISEAVSRPDELLEGMQMEHLIQQAILELDEEQRAILVLRDIQNMTYEEIRSITGLNEGTVKSRLHRARMALKDRLSLHLR